MGQRGRPTQYRLEEAQASAITMLTESDLGDVLEAWLTWPLVSSTTSTLKLDPESPPPGREWARSAATRHRPMDDTDERPLHRWFIDQLVLVLRNREIDLRWSLEVVALLEEMVASVERGPDEWPRLVADAGVRIFRESQRPSTVSGEPSVSRSDTLALRFMLWGQTTPDQPMQATRRFRAHQDLWERLLRAIDRELKPGTTPEDIVTAIGAMEDGLLARAHRTSRATRRRLEDIFATGVVSIIDGSTQRRTRPAGEDSNATSRS